MCLCVYEDLQSIMFKKQFLSIYSFSILNFSAGIGRTGTFIALDALHRQGVEKGRINVIEYVHTMRRDRMNMIQNLVICFICTCFDI